MVPRLVSRCCRGGCMSEMSVDPFTIFFPLGLLALLGLILFLTRWVERLRKIGSPVRVRVISERIHRPFPPTSDDSFPGLLETVTPVYSRDPPVLPTPPRLDPPVPDPQRIDHPSFAS